MTEQPPVAATAQPVWDGQQWTSQGLVWNGSQWVPSQAQPVWDGEQ